MLISTQSKQPLPHEHSYPIGAQAITGALAKVPQLAELGLSFYSFNKFHDESCGNCLVLAAEYRHLYVGLSAPNIMIEKRVKERRKKGSSIRSSIHRGDLLTARTHLGETPTELDDWRVAGDSGIRLQLAILGDGVALRCGLRGRTSGPPDGAAASRRPTGYPRPRSSDRCLRRWCRRGG